jgi:hypothetical protein
MDFRAAGKLRLVSRRKSTCGLVAQVEYKELEARQQAGI